MMTISYPYEGALYLNLTNKCDCACVFCLRANGHKGSIYADDLWLEHEPSREEALENLKLARKTLRGVILGGIYPVVSYKNACFLQNEIAGMRICAEIVERYRDKDRDAAEALAVAISARVAREAAPYTDGLYLMTPFQRVGLMTRILAETRAL